MIMELEPYSKDSNKLCNRGRHIARMTIKFQIQGGTCHLQNFPGSPTHKEIENSNFENYNVKKRTLFLSNQI